VKGSYQKMMTWAWREPCPYLNIQTGSQESLPLHSPHASEKARVLAVTKLDKAGLWIRIQWMRGSGFLNSDPGAIRWRKKFPFLEFFVAIFITKMYRHEIIQTTIFTLNWNLKNEDKICLLKFCCGTGSSKDLIQSLCGSVSGLKSLQIQNPGTK
jgi:hypothetical protein